MIAGLKNLLKRLRAWMAENERAHRNAKGGACCSSPSSIYAARKRDGEGAGDE